MAAPQNFNNNGWEKTMFSWVGKLNYSIKTQLGLNDLSWILSQNGSRLNCPRTFRKLNTSPYAYSSTLTTLETFIVIESSNVSSLFQKPMFHSNRKLFQNGRRIIWISPVRHRVSGKPARPPAESPCLESLCPGKQLCPAMAAGENALTMRSLFCRPLV